MNNSKRTERQTAMAEVREVEFVKIGDNYVPRTVKRLRFSKQIQHFAKLAMRGPHPDASPEEIAANWIAKSMLENLRFYVRRSPGRTAGEMLAQESRCFELLRGGRRD